MWIQRCGKVHDWNRNGQGLIAFKDHNLISAIFTMSYDDAQMSLPKKTENNLTVKLEGQHKEIYEGILTETREMYKKMMNDLCSFTYVLAMFTRLRQCAIAPYLITPDAKRNSKEKNNCSKWCLDKFGGAGIKSSKILKIVEIIKSVTLMIIQIVTQILKACTITCKRKSVLLFWK